MIQLNMFRRYRKGFSGNDTRSHADVYSENHANRGHGKRVRRPHIWRRLLEVVLFAERTTG